jgi:demethylmenaquinone methyltransferase/2-methoxy-6-polyprenyl-1,4-benzoquinol methylase
MEERQVLDEQIAYYRARAGEYDEWFFREGRYDRGPEHRAAWFREVAAVEAALKAANPRGDVLELACGTGLWTRHLLETAERITAVDASPETIAVNRERTRSDRVEYVGADIFSWTPPRQFDFALFTFWLSHVPTSRFASFWAMLARALRPGGRVFFIDSLLQQDSTARDHASIDDSGIVRRKLNDGREFDIVKIFYEPGDLGRRLAALGWRGDVRGSGRFFVYGSVGFEGAAR